MLGLSLSLASVVRVAAPEAEPEPELILIDRTAGTNIGNLTSSGGLAASFDGVTVQTSTASSALGANQDSWVGKTLAATKVFGRAVAYCPSNAGFSSVSTTVTMTVRGKNGAAPAGPSEGTLIGSLAPFTPGTTAADIRTIESSDLVNTWDHIWLRIQTANSATIRNSELELYEWGVSE